MYVRTPKDAEEKEIKENSVPSKNLLRHGLYWSHFPLNDPIIFITNSTADKTKGSSLYFVGPHGTIRCRSDHTELDRPPIITINPFTIGYFKATERITTLKPTVGFRPFEAEIYKAEEANVEFLNLIREHKRDRSRHQGYVITEIISLAQLNDPTFIPKTWVNEENVGILWSNAVHQIKEAAKNAALNLRDHFQYKEMVISIKKKERKRFCAIS